MKIRRVMRLIHVSILIAITVFVIWHAPIRLMAEEASEPALTRIWSLDDDDFYLEMQSLSPDGTKLVGIHIAMDAGQNVAYKDLTTGKCEFITNFDWESEGHGFTGRPVWSPDGKEVAFNFCGFSDNIWELRIADIEGESRTIQRSESEGQGMMYPCRWFPNGNNILAIHITSDNVVQLGIFSVKGGDFEVIDLAVVADLGIGELSLAELRDPLVRLFLPVDVTLVSRGHAAASEDLNLFLDLLDLLFELGDGRPLRRLPRLGLSLGLGRK